VIHCVRLELIQTKIVKSFTITPFFKENRLNEKMLGKKLLFASFFSIGIAFIVLGYLTGRATRMVVYYFFNYAVPDRIVTIERIPFFLAGGALMAVGVGVILLLGDK